MKGNPVVQIPSLTVNHYAIAGNGTYILVDSPFLRRGTVIADSLAKRGVDPGDISLILLTHGHVDHFGSALGLRERTGAPIAIHELDADAPRRGRSVQLYPTRRFERAVHPIARRLRVNSFEPDILLSGEEGDLGEWGVAAKWVRTPGHTEGSISVVIPGEVAIVGDLVIGRYGFRKRPAFPLFNKEPGWLRESVRRVLEYEPRLIFSGHGGPFKAERIRGFINRRNSA